MGRSERQRALVYDGLVSLVDAGLVSDDARRAAVELLRRVVGFDRWCWPLTDPGSGLASGGIGEVDFWPSLPRLVALEQYGDLTSKPRLVAGRRASVSLSGAAGGDLARSRRWRECFEPYGIGDELMTACRDRHGCWGTLELLRDAADGPFDEADVRLLHELAPVLGRLVRRSLAREWRAPLADTASPAPATLILDAELRPTSWTPAFDAWLVELGADRSALPPAVFELGARVLAPPEAAGGPPASVRLRTAGGRCAVIEGAALEGADRGRAVVTVRGATVEERVDLLCRTYDLSPRERQLVGLLTAGLATDEVASTLHISPHTVQDHLKAVFAKTGVRGRRRLVSHLAGA